MKTSKKEANMNHETFRDMKNRNKRAKELKAQGYAVRKRSTGPQQLHPEYIKDWTEPFETGFGNTDYLTMHKNLYVVEWGEL